MYICAHYYGQILEACRSHNKSNLLQNNTFTHSVSVEIYMLIPSYWGFSSKANITLGRSVIARNS